MTLLSRKSTLFRVTSPDSQATIDNLFLMDTDWVTGFVISIEIPRIQISRIMQFMMFHLFYSLVLYNEKRQKWETEKGFPGIFSARMGKNTIITNWKCSRRRIFCLGKGGNDILLKSVIENLILIYIETVYSGDSSQMEKSDTRWES